MAGVSHFTVKPISIPAMNPFGWTTVGPNFFGVSDKKGRGFSTQMWSGWYMITIDHHWSPLITLKITLNQFLFSSVFGIWSPLITNDHQWRASPIFLGGWNHQAVNELGSRESTRVSTRTSQDIRPLLVSYHVILCDMGVPKKCGIPTLDGHLHSDDDESASKLGEFPIIFRQTHIPTYFV